MSSYPYILIFGNILRTLCQPPHSATELQDLPKATGQPRHLENYIFLESVKNDENCQN